MSLGSSEVGSISEYSLPRSLTPYFEEGRSIRSRRKSSCEASVSSGRGRVRGMSVRTPPPLPQFPLNRHPSKKSIRSAPSSPPPSCPLPDPPVSIRHRSPDAVDDAGVRPDSAVLAIDAPLVASSSQIPEFANVDSLLPVLVSSTGGGRLRAKSVSAIAGLRMEPAMGLHTKTEPSTSILSDLEISTFTSTSTSPSSSDLELSNEHKLNTSDEKEKDNFPTSIPDRTAASTPTTPTPRQYGVGRQVLRGSGCDFQCDFEDLGTSSKRNSKRSSKRSSKRESGMLGRSSVPESTPESIPDSKSEVVEVEDGERLKEPSIPTEPDGGIPLNLDLESKQDPTGPTPSHNPRKRVKSDDTNPSNDPHTNTSVNTSGGVSGSRRTEKPRERINPEWTLYLGVPRNAPHPVPPALPVNVESLSPSIPLGVQSSPSHATGSKLVSIPASTSTTAHPTGKSENQRQETFFPTYLPLMARNRTKSDSALLASASGSNSKHGVSTKDNGKAKAKTKTKRTSGGEDWTLSLPLMKPSEPLPPLPSVSSLLASTFRGSESVQAVDVEEVEECEGGIDGEMGAETGLVITVEDVDCQQQQGAHRSGGEYEDENSEDDGEEEEEEALILRVPRIVRSCSASPLISTSTHANANMHNRKKGWMGTTSTPNLRTRDGAVERLSSSTLEEEVMVMLLGNTDNTDLSEAAEQEESKRRSKSRKDLVATMVLAQRKIATLDEDLARFNALLRNGSGSRPSSTVIEAAAVTKTKTVTLNSNPIPASTSTPRKSSVASQTLPIKPVLKHAKSCEPFLESHSSVASVGHPPLPPPHHMGPVMRFPSSTGRGDMNFFDELGSLGGGDGRPHSGRLRPTSANLRPTKSAEWRMPGELADSNLCSTTTLPPPTTLYNVPIPPASIPSTPPRASPPPQYNTRSPTSSTSSSTQTVLLPFASTGSSSARRGGPMPSGSSSARAVSMGSLRPSTAPVESISGITISPRSQKEKRQKPGTPPQLRLHTSSLPPSSSTSSQRHTANPSRNRRSVSPPPQPPSPIASESSSTLPTPLASAFPLPPSSLGMAFQQKLREFESAREKYLEQQQQQQQQQRSQCQRYRPPSTASSVTSLVSNASSTATIVPSGDQKLRMRSSEPGDRSSGGGSNSDGVAVAALAGVQENERYTLEDDEDSMYSGTYYSARSSFSSGS
ncbi:hypothetical protein BYT27DRAFT_7218511 [Phlegmacium glaucopus]|nr:hypothetical protein BYT27DRAFT_7218511 [Phlegmacium glaucopus]